jgi:hypothetical protein
MKKLVLLLCLLAPMALLAQRPAFTHAPALSQVTDPCLHADGTFCLYAWDKVNRCCNPTFIAPKANCPRLCE